MRPTPATHVSLIVSRSCSTNEASVRRPFRTRNHEAATAGPRSTRMQLRLRHAGVGRDRHGMASSSNFSGTTRTTGARRCCGPCVVADAESVSHKQVVIVWRSSRPRASVDRYTAIWHPMLSEANAMKLF